MKSTIPNDQYRRLKQLAVTALFADDRLMDTLVLKGGNALYLVYGMAQRASLDLDFSMEGEFGSDDWPRVKARLYELLVKRFGEENLCVFDFRADERPPELSEALRDFWGGYLIEFKVIETSKYNLHASDGAARSRNALTVGPGQKRTIQIDISKHEFCGDKCGHTMDGYNIFVYTPKLIVVEKLRAICQQMPSYNKVVKRQNRSGRARDFFDIHQVCLLRGVEPTSDLAGLTRQVFDAKRVPWRSLIEIKDYRELHEADFPSLIATLSGDEQHEPFEVYFDFVLEFAHRLHTFGNV